MYVCIYVYTRMYLCIEHILQVCECRKWRRIVWCRTLLAVDLSIDLENIILRSMYVPYVPGTSIIPKRCVRCALCIVRNHREDSAAVLSKLARGITKEERATYLYELHPKNTSARAPELAVLNTTCMMMHTGAPLALHNRTVPTVDAAFHTRPTAVVPHFFFASKSV